MFRRSALPAAASLAVVLLAVTGCKIQVSDAAPGGTSTAGAVPAGTSGVPRSGPLIVEPGAGFSPVYSLINGARHSIDVTMYEFSDTTAEHDLAAAAKSGVPVRVILDRRARSVNSDAYSYLRSHHVAVTWSSPDYHYTHQKTVIIDGTKAVIMTANLTSRYYATSRDFLVTDTERADVSAITTVFNADFNKKAVRPGDGSDLVWSPTDSQDHLIGLINGATSSLRIYSEEMGDRTIENALIRAAKRGVDVQVCGENESGEYDSAFAKLARAGIRISYYSSSAGFYIHGKVVEADYGTKHGKIFIGSENFSDTSLNQNRELGLIISSPPSCPRSRARSPRTSGTAGTGPRHRVLIMTVNLVRSGSLYPGVPYAYASVAPRGSLIFTAGACPLDDRGEVVGAGDVRAQASLAVANLATALAESGATLADVLKTTVFVASAERADLVAAWDVVSAAFGEHDAPSTLLGVAVLGYQDQLVEIEAVAAAPG